MNRNYFPAFLIAVLVIAWLASGWLGKAEAQVAPSLAKQNKKSEQARQDSATRVRAEMISASPQTGSVLIRGRSEANRIVNVKAETSGRIIALPLARGAVVEPGDALCQLAEENRKAKVEEAVALVHQATLEYEGAYELSLTGLQSEASLAAAKARLASEQANLSQRKLDVERTLIRAPFAGILEDLPVEIGDYLKSGDACALVVDLNPIVFMGQVAERDIGSLKVGSKAKVVFLNDQSTTGVVRFVSKNAGQKTRTYDVEIEAPNPGVLIPSGLTVTIKVPTEVYLAHRISPALLTLNDAGNLGVRILDRKNQVLFQEVQLIKDSPEGVWVSGLPPITTIIVTGQELVVSGEFVEFDLLGKATPKPPKIADSLRSNKPNTLKEKIKCFFSEKCR